eukprot:5137461-Pleurochrysis_carterae.AAC.1
MRAESARERATQSWAERAKAARSPGGRFISGISPMLSSSKENARRSTIKSRYASASFSGPNSIVPVAAAAATAPNSSVAGSTAVGGAGQPA